MMNFCHAGDESGGDYTDTAIAKSTKKHVYSCKQRVSLIDATLIWTRQTLTQKMRRVLLRVILLRVVGDKIPFR